MKTIFFQAGNPLLSLLVNAVIFFTGFTIGRFLYTATHDLPFTLLPSFGG